MPCMFRVKWSLAQMIIGSRMRGSCRIDEEYLYYLCACAGNKAGKHGNLVERNCRESHQNAGKPGQSTAFTAILLRNESACAAQ